MKVLGVTCFLFYLASTSAQYENGFVKILEDQRYQDGAAFGNFRNQEDGTKYKEETDLQGVRRGSWEYIDADGVLRKVEFEAGRGIGFRIISSNIVEPTILPGELPLPAPQQPVRQPAPVARPAQRAPVPVVNPFQIPTTTKKPEPVNLFDYPANLQFFRDHQGHRFSFSAI